MLNFLLKYTPLLYLTQSLWRDEAFTILLAQKPIGYILNVLSLEPPLPYITLHLFMGIFGNQELLLRSFMFFVYCVSVIVVIFWAEKIFPKHWLSWYLPIFFFLNPMLLYYGFEIRSYSWYILFIILSSCTYLCKRWHWYILTTILGFFTHIYFLLVIATQLVHWLITHYQKKSAWHPKIFSHDPYLRSFLGVCIGISPWLIKLTTDLPKLGKSSWYFPVDAQLLFSVIGNLFTGFEGTPWYGWHITRWLSIVVLAIICFTASQKKRIVATGYFILLFFLPLIITLGISIYKPLFTNRYLLPTTIAEVFLITLGIYSIKNQFWQKSLASLSLMFIVIFNLWFPNQHPKFDSRTLVRETSLLQKSTDLIFIRSPLLLFEAMYYAKRPETVFWYNPDDGIFPWFVGDILVTAEHIRSELPTYPNRAIILETDGTYAIFSKQVPGNY